MTQLRLSAMQEVDDEFTGPDIVREFELDENVVRIFRPVDILDRYAGMIERRFEFRNTLAMHQEFERPALHVRPPERRFQVFDPPCGLRRESNDKRSNEKQELQAEYAGQWRSPAVGRSMNAAA
jgi:hypothetical protein